jgi:hypothetical protein
MSQSLGAAPMRYMETADGAGIGFDAAPCRCPWAQIDKEDVNTPAVFGEFIDSHAIDRAVEDWPSVAIYYQSRRVRIAFDEDERALIDEAIVGLTEDEGLDEQERLMRSSALQRHPRHCRHQLLSVGVLGIAAHPLRGTVLEDAPGAHD